MGGGVLSVSVLYLTKNGFPSVKDSLLAVTNQQYEGSTEIICIDSGSTDGTREFIRDLGLDLHTIHPSEFQHGRTRNLAGSLAKHEILVFLTQDAIPASNQWLKSLVAPFEDAKTGGTYGRQIPRPDVDPVRARSLESLYPAARQVKNLSEVSQVHVGLFRFSNANSAVRADVWRRFKFSETTLMCEDQGMCRDIIMSGMSIVYVPQAAVIHSHERTLWGEFRWAVDNGISLKRLGILGNPEIGGEFRYGIKKVRDDWRYFRSRKMYSCALKSLTVSGVKWLGVQFGKREDILPFWIKTRISSVPARHAKN